MPKLKNLETAWQFPIPPKDTVNRVWYDGEVVGMLGRREKDGTAVIMGDKAGKLPRPLLDIEIEGNTVADLGSSFVLLTRKGDENIPFSVVGSHESGRHIKIKGTLREIGGEVVINPSEIREVA